MSSQTLLYIILSGFIALLLALFQYLYKVQKTTLNRVFTGLRFITYFAVFLLIINPKFDKVSYSKQKPNLVVAIDNSNSIKHLGQDKKTLDLLSQIENNQALNKRFNVSVYSFSDALSTTDSIAFNGKRTNIARALNTLSQVYQNTVAPIVLVTDGNQTYGSNYLFSTKTSKQPIFPVILGDTITYTDLKIDLLNVNRYAFLNNRFPVEAFVVYDGTDPIDTNFEVLGTDGIVFKKPIHLSKQNTSERITFTLPAKTIGVQSFKTRIVPVSDEKNTINNSKEFAVEVISQKTNIALVSAMIHPDLGAIKKSIESNEQRTVSILKPSEYLAKQNDYQLVVLYQPNTSFKPVLGAIAKSRDNYFIITGLQTDWNFLNTTQQVFSKKASNISEYYQPNANPSYSTFILDDIQFNSFPPLEASFEAPVFNVNTDVLLYQTVNGINTNQPLLATFETNGTRGGVLFGQGIWRWRAQSYLNEKSFDAFDGFMAKLVQYLSSNRQKGRLSLNYESFYNSNDAIIIEAQYFDKNFEFDPRASLSVSIKNEDNSTVRTFPLILKNNAYQVDLSSLNPDSYSFTVLVKDEPLSQSGHFKIIPYNIEQQFLNADVTKLQHLATNTNGKSYFIDQVSPLFQDLLKDDRFQTIQLSNKNTVPLIDFQWLLALIALSLAIEWFLRKFNGLI